MHRRTKGDRFEQLAWSWLESHGYSLIKKNFARRFGEVDLIVQDPDGLTIVFVEVRFRSSELYGGAIASVDYRKQRKLVSTANCWLQRFAQQNTPARIDIIAFRPAPPNAPTEIHWHGFVLNWVKNAVED